MGASAARATCPVCVGGGGGVMGVCEGGEGYAGGQTGHVGVRHGHCHALALPPLSAAGTRTLTVARRMASGGMCDRSGGSQRAQ